ncbi:DUF411 domain-containing protein [Tianweitania populi]|uniref:DUF411 domain-containing protein n=1 Tax=Tianweitania populi TaxID=1607949 RepID=A0A8J3DNM0_9HYPH|nr:DUF411 domain-containing protein [Tianweitania populi]GHD14021.1 hypothetical protein GCM10016234_19050 [Tianweitania populi]
MSTHLYSRRKLLLAASALGLTLAMPAANAQSREIHVLKDPNCGCCSAWVNVMQKAGFKVTVETIDAIELDRYKRENGIPEALFSCHTAHIDGYLIEGHVPAADIVRLLDERRDAIGLSAPGMPTGAPGMGSEAEREAYDVVLFGKNGKTEIFSHYDAA